MIDRPGRLTNSRGSPFPHSGKTKSRLPGRASYRIFSIDCAIGPLTAKCLISVGLFQDGPTCDDFKFLINQTIFLISAVEAVLRSPAIEEHLQFEACARTFSLRFRNQFN
jgi:hypothetical protein